MLHFLIFKTSLDSLGLLNIQSRARGEGVQQLTLRRLVALNSSKQRNYCAALQDIHSLAAWLSSTVANVEQLLVPCGTSVEQFCNVVTELRV